MSEREVDEGEEGPHTQIHLFVCLFFASVFVYHCEHSSGHRRMRSKPDCVRHQSAQATVVSGESQAVSCTQQQSQNRGGPGTRLQ